MFLMTRSYLITKSNLKFTCANSSPLLVVCATFSLQQIPLQCPSQLRLGLRFYQPRRIMIMSWRLAQPMPHTQVGRYFFSESRHEHPSLPSCASLSQFSYLCGIFTLNFRIYILGWILHRDRLLCLPVDWRQHAWLGRQQPCPSKAYLCPCFPYGTAHGPPEWCAAIYRKHGIGHLCTL